MYRTLPRQPTPKQLVQQPLPQGHLVGEAWGPVPGSPGVLVENAIPVVSLPEESSEGGASESAPTPAPRGFSALGLRSTGLGFLALGMRNPPGLSDNGLFSGLP